LKIAMITTWQDLCGIYTYSKALAPAIAAQGHEVYIVRMPFHGRKPYEILYNIVENVPKNADLIHCFIGKTPILTSEGLKNIEDVKIGDLVYTHTGELGTVKNLFKRNYEGKVITLHAKYNTPITCTLEHPFLSVKTPWKDNHIERLFKKRTRHRCDSPILEPKWTPSESIEIGDFVTIPRIKAINNIQYLPLGDIPKRNYESKDGYIWSKARNIRKKLIKTTIDVNADFCRLIGYYISEGSSRGTQLRFSFNKKEQTLIDDVDTIIKSLGFEGTCNKYTSGNGITLTYSCRPLATLLSGLGGVGAKNKHLPLWGLTTSNENLSEIIKGIYLGDGNIQRDGFKIESYSSTLREQLRLAFARLGIAAGVYKTSVKICGSGIKILEQLWNINHPATSKWGFRDFCHVTDDYIFYRISEKTEDQYTGFVYNLEITPNNSYLVEGYAVHNCQHEYGLYQNNEPNFYQALKLLKKPIVTTMHAVGNPQIDEAISSGSNRLITHNEYCKSHLDYPSTIIPHGCAVKPTADEAISKRKYGIPSEAPIIGYLGYISPYKGLETLIEAVRNTPGVALAIAGGSHSAQDTEYLVKLKDRTLRELQGRCVWLGYIPEQDLKYAYAAMDLLVYPSRYATESGALLTAMGYGRVILASKLPPFVEKEKVGALATYANVAELQQAIKVLIANEDQRASIKVKALAYCEKNSWEEVAKMHIKLYEEVLNNVGVDMATKAPTEDIRQS